MAEPVREPQRQTVACAVCHELHLSNDDVWRLNLGDIRQQAVKDQPCLTCAMLWSCICAVVDDISRLDIVYPTLVIVGSEHGDMIGSCPLIGHLIPDPVAFGKQPIDLQFYTSIGEPRAPWNSIGQGHHMHQSALSESSVSLFRQWLSACTASVGKHAQCPKPDIPLLPTRVIHVGNATTKPRLHIANPTEKGRYTALSHCWGGEIPTKTRMFNVEEYTRSLPEHLPQTFLDAISITRVLGIEYIWIDSLCILQDSTEDWQAESANMAQVYSNAHVMIAADAASDSSAGFLTEPSRKAPPYHGIRHRVGSMDGATGEPCDGDGGVIHVRKRGFLAEELPFHCWLSAANASGRSRLSTRGWVFQERLLSPRALHFSEHEVAWECRSICDCECSTTSLRTQRTTSVVKHFLFQQTGQHDSFTEMWRRDIVPAYTRLGLTWATDRLPALAGLAQVASRIRRGDVFLAGLWRETLAKDLLWSVTGNTAASCRQPVGYAPSWSWASVTGSIIYATRQLRDDPPAFSPVDIVFDGNLPTILVGLCPMFPVTITRSWSDKDSQVQVSGAGEQRGGSLAVTWDCSTSDRRWIESKNVVCMLLVCGLNKGGNGPVGLLVASRWGYTTSHENPSERVGLVDGFKKRAALRRWSSCGWETPDDGRDRENDDTNRDRKKFDWAAELQNKTKTKVYIQ